MEWDHERYQYCRHQHMLGISNRLFLPVKHTITSEPQTILLEEDANTNSIKVITEKGIYIFQMAQMYSSVCQTQGTLSWLLVLTGTLWFVPLLSRLFQRGRSDGWDNGDRTEREAADNGDAGQSKHSAHHAEAPEWFLSILGVFLIKTQVNFFGCSETRPTLPL